MDALKNEKFNALCTELSYLLNIERQKIVDTLINLIKYQNVQ